MSRGVGRHAFASLGLMVTLVLAVVACEQTVEHASPHARHSAVHHSARPGTSRRGPAPADAPPDGGSHSGSAAQAALDRLPVKGRAPMTGYTRAEFGAAWSDDNDERFGHNGCDTRNDILRRDLGQLTIEPGTEGCVVSEGVLHDPYGDTVINFVRGVGTSEAVQIDHVVALGDAWQTGAQQWSATRRQDFANDPLELLAVDGSLNMSKGDGDAATWLPPSRAFRCSYVARQIAVKARWGLWVTPAERAAMTQVLARCGGQRLP